MGSLTSRRKNPIEEIKHKEREKKNTFARRGQSIKLSSTPWDCMHQRKLSTSTLKKIPGIKLSPRALKLPEVTTDIEDTTQRFMNKV